MLGPVVMSISLLLGSSNLLPIGRPGRRTVHAVAGRDGSRLAAGQILDPHAAGALVYIEGHVGDTIAVGRPGRRLPHAAYNLCAACGHQRHQGLYTLRLRLQVLLSYFLLLWK